MQLSTALRIRIKEQIRCYTLQEEQDSTEKRFQGLTKVLNQDFWAKPPSRKVSPIGLRLSQEYGRVTNTMLWMRILRLVDAFRNLYKFD